jgi:hypothetical protein
MTKNTLGDGPIEAAYQAKMKAIAQAIDDFLNDGAKGDAKKIGFILMVFPFNDNKGRCNYMSSADRDDVIVLLKEQLKRFEGQPDVEGKA